MTSLQTPMPRGILAGLDDARRQLEQAARDARIVAFCGIPGVGKSLLLREQHALALQHGRRVSRLQWDIARQAFEIPAVLSRYPEVAGSTHVAIRHAAGLWVRAAIERWHRTHPSDNDLLLVEAPLVGGRFSELARVCADAAEPLLNSVQTRFFVPTPSGEVRLAIEAARRAETQSNRHARDRANAVPQLVDALWREVADTAAHLRLGSAGGASAYSPELYFALYRTVLRHRRVSRLTIDRVVADQGSPHALNSATEELAPTAEEVQQALALTEAQEAASVAERAARWFDT
jgi:hypothetical protein